MRKSHVTRMHESRDTFERWWKEVTKKTSQERKKSRIDLTLYMSDSLHTLQRIMSHACVGDVTHMNESRHTGGGFGARFLVGSRV